LGEMVLRVLRQVAQRRRLADSLLDVDLRLVQILALLLELRLLVGIDELHDRLPDVRASTTLRRAKMGWRSGNNRYTRPQCRQPIASFRFVPRSIRLVPPT